MVLSTIGRTRGRAAQEGGPEGFYASLRNPPRLSKRRSLNQELFKQNAEGSHMRHRPSLTSIDTNVEISSPPSSRGSPYSTYSQRSQSRHGSAIANFEDRYVKQATTALCEAISHRLRVNELDFTIPSDSIEFERTSLSHMQDNKTFAKICAMVMHAFEGRGYLVKVRAVEQLEVSHIQEFAITVKHASMSVTEPARPVRAYNAERLAAAAKKRILIID